MNLAEVLAALNALPQEEYSAVREKARAFISAVDGRPPLWVPNPGPQTAAYECEAEEALVGGSAGGGKSALLVGLALTRHERSLLLRRTNKEAHKFSAEIEEIVGSRSGYNGQRDEWRVDGRQVDVGGCQHEDDKQKFKGSPHDLICFDELPDFSLTQYMFIRQWNRTTTKGQRCRTVATSNGPTTAAGMWVVERWAAWLDPTHPNPAQSGEIRWYLVNAMGKEVEVDGPGPYTVLGREVNAISRTFIRSTLADNPDLAATNYGSLVMAQGDQNRRAYALGDFTVGLQDDPDQAIPTEWVRQAQERWQPVPPVGVPMCSIGCDVAQGGADKSTLAPRYDSWFGRIVERPGADTPTGTEVAALVMAHRRDNAEIVIDVGGGWGAEAYGHIRANGIDNAVAFMGVKASSKRTVNNQLTFQNVRTEAYWRLREALDPSQPGGSQIALPDDRVMLADLCAPRYTVRSNGIVLEAKDEVTKRIGRSPDRGDAVVMAWYAGARMASDWGLWKASQRGGVGKVVPRVVMSRQLLSARR